VLGHKQSFVLVVALSLSFLAIVPVPAQAYLGPGTGLDFIPQFLALLSFAGVAAGAILLWPFFTLMRLIRGKKDPKNEVKTETTIVHVTETQCEGCHDKP
jgi:hypothetical protein